MRVSTWEHDTGYVNFDEYKGSAVYVDGVKIEKVFIADDELGEVVCADLDENGNIYTIPYTGYGAHSGERDIATRTVRGRVEIVKP